MKSELENTSSKDSFSVYAILKSMNFHKSIMYRLFDEY